MFYRTYLHWDVVDKIIYTFTTIIKTQDFVDVYFIAFL